MRVAKMLLMSSLLSTVTVATFARAEEKPSAPAPAAAPAQVGPVITAAPMKIAGRSPRPQAATEIAKSTMARPLADLKQPLIDRVEKAIEKAPF